MHNVIQGLTIVGFAASIWWLTHAPAWGLLVLCVCAFAWSALTEYAAPAQPADKRNSPIDLREVA